MIQEVMTAEQLAKYLQEVVKGLACEGAIFY